MADGTYATFKTLGLVSMELNTSSKEIKKFGTPIQMTIEIPAGSTDMDGNAVTAGSTFGVYSYDDAIGKWTHEGDKSVASNNGKLEVTFEMSHLSFWQVASKKQSNNSYSYNEYIFNGTCADYFYSQNNIHVKYLNYMGRVEYDIIANTILNKTYYFVSASTSYQNQSGIAKLIWYKTNNSSLNIEASADNGHSAQTVTFPSSWCEPAKEFTVKLETNCPDNPERKILPGCTVFAWEEGGAMKLLGQMTNGELKTSTANFETGKKYALITFYQNKLVALTGSLTTFDFGYRTFDGTEVDLSRPLTDIECTYLRTK